MELGGVWTEFFGAASSRLCLSFGIYINDQFTYRSILKRWRRAVGLWDDDPVKPWEWRRK